MTAKVSSSQLYRECVFGEVSTSDPLELGQARAVEAIRLALAMGAGHHVFVIGRDDTGNKQAWIRRLLAREARRHPTASDWCYVHDPSRPRQPRALRVPAGTSTRLQLDLRASLEAIRHALTTAPPPQPIDAARIGAVVHPILDAGMAAHRGAPEVATFLADLERDLIAALVLLANRQVEPREIGLRFDVNIIIQQSDSVPIVDEVNPTRANLIGRLEHEPFQGTLVTNYHHIRPGALHRASGGYLLLDAAHVLRSPGAWEALEQTLLSKIIRIESPDPITGASLVSLAPEPIPLDVTVVLFADTDLYDRLLALAPHLAELFRVTAEIAPSVERDASTEALFAAGLVAVARDEGLLAFTRDALARVVEHAARTSGDARRLSLADASTLAILEEASLRSRTAGHAEVSAEDVEKSIAARDQRTGYSHDRVVEAVTRGTLVLATLGTAIGQVNALSVYEHGGHRHGFASRISARTRLGGGELVDIEREVELGGPLHSKGVLILAGFLGDRYGQHVPLALAATLVFEQSYGAVEGDSASLAELCALISAIGEVPIAQSLAVTGSINQHGEVQPVGGLHEKIEMFFDICRARPGPQRNGVIIPRRNVEQLMLRRDVVAAVAAGELDIYAVEHVDEAIALLTDLEVGTRDEQGRFPPGTVNALVEARLAHFADDTRWFMHGEHRRRPSRSTGRVIAAKSRP